MSGDDPVTGAQLKTLAERGHRPDPKAEIIGEAAELFIHKMRQKACLQLLVLRSFDIVCMQTISGFAVWPILFVPATVPGNSF